MYKTTRFRQGFYFDNPIKKNQRGKTHTANKICRNYFPICILLAFSHPKLLMTSLWNGFLAVDDIKYKFAKKN